MDPQLISGFYERSSDGKKIKLDFTSPEPIQTEAFLGALEALLSKMAEECMSELNEDPE